MFDPISSDPNESLCGAIFRRNKEVITKLINHPNINVNMPNITGDPPLFLAIMKFKDTEIITMLLDNGADIHAKNKENVKPLHVAIKNNRTEAALLLIERGALVGEDLNALLVKVIEENNCTLFKSLINHGMQYNSPMNFDVIFKTAIFQGECEIIEFLLPHCQFSQASDKYIPRELVIKRDSKYRDCVKLLLKWNFTINPTSNRDRDFIYAAVEKGYLSIVLKLLELGIDVNMVNLNTRLNLLKLACLNKHFEMVKNLLKHNASLNIIIPTDLRILNKYYDNDMEEDHQSCLLSYNEKDLEDLACLHIATVNSDLDMIKHVLSNSKLIMSNPHCFHIASTAVQNNREEIVRLLLDHGVQVHDVNSEGKSLLHFCVNRTNKYDAKYNIAALLLERGASIHLQTPGNLLTFEAINNEHRNIAKLFLNYNPDIQYTNSRGDTALHRAIETDFDAEFIEKLLKLNASINAVNHLAFTPLLTACKTKLRHQLQIIRVLLQHNADVHYSIDSKNINDQLSFGVQNNKNKLDVYCGEIVGGQTALHLICKHRFAEVVNVIKLLLQYEANIEAVDANGWTPLLMAAWSNSFPAVKCLVDNNASPYHTDKQQLNALYISARYNRYNAETIRLLLGCKVNVYCKDKQRNSVIHIIAQNNNAEVISCFIRTRINLNSINKEGDTPLHVAIKNKSFYVIEKLLKYGANINMVDIQKRTGLRNVMEHMSICRNKLEYDRIYRDFCKHHKYFSINSKKIGLNIYSYLCDLNKYKEIIKLLKRQVVKFKIANFRVSRQNLQIVYCPDDYNDYEISDQDIRDCSIDVLQFEVDCEQEIEQMKTESIHGSGVTFFTLLQKSTHALSRYIRNKEMEQVLHHEMYDKKFPLYIDIVRSRFRDAKLRCKFMNLAKQFFRLSVGSRLSEDCIDIVFSYLNIKEIRMFLRVFKVLNE